MTIDADIDPLSYGAPSHPAVMARPGQAPYRLVHFACSIEEAVATEYSDDEMPVTDGGRRPQATRPGEPSGVVAG